MRVSPPPVIELDPEALLRDVRDRLAARVPAWRDGEPDPTDPAWLLLEQSAWMVGLLQQQLNDYPFWVTRQLLHLMGAELWPARPAVALVGVTPREAGVLQSAPDAPPPWRFVCAQTEERDVVEFSPMEPSVPVRPATLRGLSEVRDGELFKLALPAEELEGLWAVADAPRRATILGREMVRYRVVAANADAILEPLAEAIQQIDQRRLGWLHLSFEKLTETEVAIDARIDAAGAFAHTVPAGRTAGGDVEAHWSALDTSPWTPPVLIAEDGALPSRVRGHSPMPGPVEGTLLLPSIPAQYATDALLVRRAVPMPPSVPDAIWRTLAMLDSRLAGLQPIIERGVAAVDDPTEPTWVPAVLASAAWSLVSGTTRRTIVHVDFPEGATEGGPFRTALVCAGAGAPPRVQVVTLLENGRVLPNTKDAKVLWSLPVPSAQNPRQPDMAHCFEVDLEVDTVGALLVVEGALRGALVNPLLVINAPVVQDGRSVAVERSVPEAISLTSEDLVTRDVLEDLILAPLPASLHSVVRSLRVSRLSLEGGRAIDDYAGVQVDPSAGVVLVNAPDRRGQARELRSGTVVNLDWYRRTDGGVGNVEAGAIAFVEQPPSAEPELLAVYNPLPAMHGAARETEDQCQQRVFGPAAGLPILPTDWERELRAALGARGRAWWVRCWGHSERTLLTPQLWPLPDARGSTAVTDPELLRLERTLQSAGPEVLLFAIGSEGAPIGDADLAFAQQAADALVARVRVRLPTVRRAEVTRLWLLSADAVPEGVSLPTHEPSQLGCTLKDSLGRTAAAPRAGLLLNAVVTAGPA